MKNKLLIGMLFCFSFAGFAQAGKKTSFDWERNHAKKMFPADFGMAVGSFGLGYMATMLSEISPKKAFTAIERANLHLGRVLPVLSGVCAGYWANQAFKDYAKADYWS